MKSARFCVWCGHLIPIGAKYCVIDGSYVLGRESGRVKNCVNCQYLLPQAAIIAISAVIHNYRRLEVVFAKPTHFKYGLCRKSCVKSDDCVNNEHGTCKGIIKEAGLTKMCACPCHDSMYQLVRNTVAVVNKSERNNPYQFTHEGDI